MNVTRISILKKLREGAHTSAIADNIEAMSMNTGEILDSLISNLNSVIGEKEELEKKYVDAVKKLDGR